ncbi:MAG: hypothetical protein J6O50_04945 [Ruminiclostridium sp.]|nr:hypothetical protein [Ruminiclostridium sp.]
MKLNKLFAGIAASAVAVTSFAVAASAVDAQGPSGQAGIAFADGSWTAQYWFDGGEWASVPTTATITGNGTYTVSVDAYTATVDEETGDDVTAPGASGLAFAALQVVDGETLFPGMVITIDSVKFDGTEVALSGTPYTSSDEGITTRVNLYNEWVSTLPDDARTVDGLAADATATPVSNGIGEWKTMEVTFTVSGADAAAADSAETEAAPAAGNVDAATDSSKGSPDTGIADVAAVAGIAVLAGGAFIVAKKRK